MKYLITGGSGFIGSALTRGLITAGHQVRVFDNDSRGRRSRLADVFNNSQFEFVSGDVRDEAAVAKACQGVDSVLHLAYVNGTEFFYTQPERILDIGVRGMLAVIAGCRSEGVRELVTMSSSEVYQSPPCIPTPETVPLVVPDVHNPRYSYGGGKIISELMTINAGRNNFDRVMIVRPHNVYGPDMGNEHVIPQLTLRLLKSMQPKEMETIDFEIQGDGQQTRSFIYIDDFVAGMLAVLNRGKHLEIYHIGTEEEVPIKQIAFEIADTFNVKINLKTTAQPSGATQRRCPSIDKIKALGFVPKYTLKQGIKTTSLWYQKNMNE